MKLHREQKLNILIALLIFTAALAPLFAEIATLEYVQGWVDLRYPDGETVEALIGDPLNKDDSIVTGDDGIATLTSRGATEITVKPNSIFSLREIDSGGEKETVMHTALGAVSFKFNRLLGKEPRISTPSSVAGIRGTEFTVYAGDEGSTLFTVDSGEVMVTSQGVPVVLYEGEGVEVKAGRAPGAKFELLGKPIDFSVWAAEKQSEFSADPVAGLRGIQKQMNDYIREVESLSVMLDDQIKLITDMKAEMIEIKEKQGDNAAQKYFMDQLSPESTFAGNINHNLRFFALTAFSMKRFVMAKQYSLLKAQQLIGTTNSMIKQSFELMNKIEENFDLSIVPKLVPNDI